MSAPAVSAPAHAGPRRPASRDTTGAAPIAPTGGGSPLCFVRSIRATHPRAPLTSARASSPCRAARVKTLRPWSGSECVSSSRAGANAAPIAAIARRSRPSLTLGTATRMGTRGSVAGAERERLLRPAPDHVGGAREQLVLALAKLLGAHLEREAALLAERDAAAVQVDAHV